MTDFAKLFHSMTLPDQPRPFFAALDAALQDRIGFVLLTIFATNGEEVLRIHTSDPVNYPAPARKPMRRTDWGDQVITGQRSFLATDMAGIRAAFFDHALIESVGGGSQISVPVVFDGACIGVLNLTAAEHGYTPAHVAEAERLAPLLIPYFLRAVAAAGHHEG